ncbi:ankyrin repeat domain-containing protein [Peribacillus deserti]|uniref:Peptidase A2 domain-containing protein n=1 Tax=Peribacillus deserti TaxID=673318 RepID=A0A2N5M9I9_9BACI|nr:ankyrin repeat domain-containing protein [Peribacillus deserti]PLT31019.1 hypothetical protein CUU66_04225 [Peribacillus deserti]
MTDFLFEKALIKRKMALAEQLLPFQNLLQQQKAAMIQQYMGTKSTFILKLIKEIEDKIDIQQCFYQALLYKNKGAVQLLLEKGADPNKLNQHGQGAFNLAISSNQTDLGILEILLHFGADINLKNKWNAGSLNAAAGSGDLNVVRYLVEKGAKVNSDALDSAAFGNHKDVVDYLVKKEIKILSKTYFTAMIRNNEEMANYLLEHDTHFVLSSNQEHNVLSMAAHKGNKDLVKKMIQKGLPEDIEERRTICSLALLAAIDQSQGHLIQLLLDYGADINFIHEDETPLDIANLTGDKQIINWIKRLGGISSGVRKIY